MNDVVQKRIFLEKIQPLIEKFPQLNVKSTIDRVFWFVRDLPEKAFVEIFTTIFDNFRTVPTPNEFNEAAKAWRKRNNFYPLNAEETETQICQYCRNSGVVRIQHLNNQTIDQLMRCNCSDSWRSEHMKFPQFEYSLKQVYKVTPCPLEWFKPSDSIVQGREFYKLVDKYQQRIRGAEKYWLDLGYKGGA